MAAPAVGPHHREIGGAFLRIEGLEGFGPPGRIEAAAGAATADAAPAVTSRHGLCPRSRPEPATPRKVCTDALGDSFMGFDVHLIANFAALALITLAGPAVVFILFYRRGAL